MTARFELPVSLLAVLAASAILVGQAPSSSEQDAFRFKSGVELVHVAATVSDSRGRFVPGLTKDDFIVYEDDVRQAISYFSAERAPVSLGIALDTSGSMAGEKIDAARRALDRFLFDLLGPEDEVFLYRFSDAPVLLQGWTRERAALSSALGRAEPHGGTAMYDTIAEAIPLAASGQNQKKSLVIISDGNDTSSRASVRDVKELIRRSAVLVYAVGIDGNSIATPFRPPRMRPQPPPPRAPTPIPLPFPRRPGRRPGGFLPQTQPQIIPRGGWARAPLGDDRVNVAALRDITDDSGGRTEIVGGPGDLEPATTSIADELSRQYHLGYASTGRKDGRWHSIRVELQRGAYHVRARRGYMAN